MDILNKILYLIKEKGLTQQAILKEFGYDKSFFSDWKAGKIKNPPIDKIVKFAEYFNVSTDYLLGLSEQKLVKTNENEKEKGNVRKIFMNKELTIMALTECLSNIISWDNDKGYAIKKGFEVNAAQEFIKKQRLTQFGLIILVR